MAKHRRKHAHKKRHARRAHYRAAGNPFKKHRRRHRGINPFSARGLTHDLTAAAVGAAGAIGVDVALAYLPVPAFLQSGWGRIGAQVVAALGLGFIAGKAVGRDTGKAVAAGALTVTAYSALKQVLAPTLGTSVKGLSGLADFGDYQGSGAPSYAIGAGMGAYMQPRLGAYMNPAAFVGSGGAAVSPIRAKQQRLGAYMAQSGFGGGSYSEDM